MVKGYRTAVDLAWRTWEKLHDSKQNAFYYYNKTSRQSQWFRPHLLGTQRGELPLTEYDYFATPEYLSSQTKIHQISPEEAADVVEDKFVFGLNTHILEDEKDYVVHDVPKDVLHPPGREPHPEDDGDTGLLSATTGDSSRWTCPANMLTVQGCCAVKYVTVPNPEKVKST